MKAPSKPCLIIGGFSFIFLAVWALWVAYTVLCMGDMMIGFHPVVLLALPLAGLSTLVFIMCLFLRQWFISVSLFAGIAALIISVLLGNDAHELAWKISARVYSPVNTEAISSINTKLSPDEFTKIWQEKYLSPLPEFKWYCDNHIAAPDGIYYGFTLLGIPHVRVQKIRHGWAGLALLQSADQVSLLSENAGWKYERIPNSSWVKWHF